jgi:beta-N-acetylhexosaminidase
MSRRRTALAALLSACVLAPGAAPAAPSSLERLVGQTVITGMSGTQPSATLLDRIRAGQVGGVIFFGANLTSAAAAKSLIAELQRAAAAGGNPPLLIALDQEGGDVRRLPGPPALSEAAYGAAGSASRVRAAGVATGRYLRGVGVGVDLAPVLDTPNSDHNFLGDRTYSRNAALNARLGSAFVDGLQSVHVAATGKHFPGLGTATQNTDLAHVFVTTPKPDLDARLAPFRAAVQAGVKLVMVSNAGYRAYDPSGLPAVLSPRIVGGVLRKQLGFRGVVISDALEAPGPSSRPDAAALALRAGVDLLLYTSETTSRAGFERALADARDGRLPLGALRAADARIAALKQWIAEA